MPEQLPPAVVAAVAEYTAAVAAHRAALDRHLAAQRAESEASHAAMLADERVSDAWRAVRVAVAGSLPDPTPEVARQGSPEGFIVVEGRP